MNSVAISEANAEALRQNAAGVDLFSEIQVDLPKVEAALESALSTDSALLVEVGTHLLRAGGKRLRPALVLLAGKPFGYPLERLVPVAAAAELIHMATLVHDDIVDSATVRRGLPTVNARWSNAVSVLCGDFLFARAFSMLAAEGNPRVVRCMADVVYEMSTGELQQMSGARNPNQTPADYFSRIAKKTAYFIAECCRVGTIVAGAGEREIEAMYRYGLNLGLGFQIVDDLLDLTATQGQIGKPVGSDLRSGIITLPVLYALEEAPPEERAEMSRLLSQPVLQDAEVHRIIGWVAKTRGLQRAAAEAERLILLAVQQLEHIPAGETAQTLKAVADFVLARKY